MSGAVAAVASPFMPTLSLPTSVSENRAIAANAEVQLTNAGDINQNTIGGGVVDIGDWISPKAYAPGGYTIRAHLNSGTAPDTGDVLDSDLALSSTRKWGRSQSVSGTSQSVLALTLKNASGVTVKTSTCTLTATVP